MRRVYIYSLLLFAICFAGCEHKLDSYPPHLYRYYLAFIDKSGNDLLADVPFEINSERILFYYAELILLSLSNQRKMIILIPNH